MYKLLLDGDEQDDELDEIERSIRDGITFKKKSDDVDFVREFGSDIERVSKQLNVNSNFKKPDFASFALDDADDKIEDPADWGPYADPKKETKYQAPYNLNDDYEPSSTARPNWSTLNPDDEQLNRMTDEERKQTHVDNVLKGMDKVDDEADYVQQESEEDEMAKLVESIDLLRNNLESEGINLDRVPEVNAGMSKKEIKAILRILQIKNDRLRYCDIFEEGILAGAYGLESIFNGQREILGTKIDLTGYSDTVKVKLRRMRYDTSNFVSSIMQGYNIHSGWRIALELIPSLFLYSRDRRLKANDNLMTDAAYKKAMQDLS